MTPEQKVKTEICCFLSTIPGLFFWTNATQGTYDPKRGIFRKNNGRFAMNGVPDIIGVLPRNKQSLTDMGGRALFIEVKSPTGKLSENQAKFLARALQNNAVAFVARSVTDVYEKFIELGLVTK